MGTNETWRKKMKPADAKFDDWLEWFCEGVEGRPRPCCLPNGWRFATDGRLGVAVNDNGPVFDLPEGRFTKLPKRSVAMMEAAPEQSALIGPNLFGEAEHPLVHTCDRCNGTNKVDHICGCDYCEAAFEECPDCNNGIETEVPDVRHICMWNVPFDANRIAYLLHHAPTQPHYRFDLIPSEGGSKHVSDWILRIMTPGWIGFVACMQESVKREHDCPELILEKAAP